MKFIGRILLALVLAVGLVVPLTACEEDAGDEMEDAAEETEDAAEELGEDAEDAADEIEEEVD